MSTQAARTIRFTHTSPQRAFRLLELTPEVLELISSENAPTLYLKSPQPDTTAGQDDASSNNAYVNLCTPNKTFRIRQVQSSNSIHVIQPSDRQSKVVPLVTKRRQSDQNNDADDNDEDEEMDISDSVTAIAKCGSTLELHALNDEESFSSAKQLLLRILPVYDHPESGKRAGDGDVEMAGTDGNGVESEISMAAKKRRLKEAIFNDLPFANSQCQAAWVELCAFVHDNFAESAAAGVFRPSASAKLQLWKRILEGCILHSIDLEKQFLVRDLWKAALGEDNDEDEELLLSRGLFDAVVRRLSERTGSTSSDSELKWSNMDKSVCVQWIGQTYLEAIAPTEQSAIGRSEFLNAWKDLLPEAWRNEASLSKLPEASYKYPDPASICFVHESEREMMKKGTGDASGNAVKAKNSRNWHERFKSQRK